MRKRIKVKRTTTVERINLAELDFSGAFLRRLMPKGTWERGQRAKEKAPPHGSVAGTAQQIAEREAWFCHNYPMAKCHRGAYRLGNGQSVVFANDGYPDYNLAALGKWLNKHGTRVAAQVVERGYTLLLVIETDDVVALDNWIWSAWHYRCHERVVEQGSEQTAVIYAAIQQEIAHDVMSGLGLDCAPIDLAMEFVEESE